MSDKKILRIALIGKTGHGKSSTGNTLLGREAFEDANLCCSHTDDVDMEESVFEDLILLVFDTPGLMHVDLSDKEDKKRAIANMDVLMDMSGGIDVFLLVYSYINKYTKEEREVVALLEKIFGKTTLGDHGIIVVTHGDSLEKDLKNGQLVEESFEQWCSSQPISFQKLKEKMKNRITLVYNKGTFSNGDKRNDSSLQLLKKAIELSRAKHGPFTAEDYEKLKRCCVIS